jgi:BirA family transcriptional regulator, biotin operon repressor / biotin---[acetyl-CoA-carboxylase] ligase
VTESPWSAAADPSRRIGRTVEFHPQIGSTNDRARQVLAEPDGDGRAVVADEQTAGRGRRGRTWVSPAGVNLAVSVGLRLPLDAAAAGLLGIAAALAVRDACAEVASGHDLRVKWPNDVVDASGLKLAGLLIETSLEAARLTDVVIGAGINVNWRRADMPPDVRERATSLCEITGAEVDRVSLLSVLLTRLDREMRAMERGESPVSRLRAHSALDGRHVTVDLGAERLDGQVAGTSDGGLLLLDTPAGRVALAIGEVVAVRELAVGTGAEA